MRTEGLQSLEARYKRFIRDIALVFVYDVVGLVLFVLAFITDYMEAFLILGTFAGVFIGMGFGQKPVMLYRILRRTKWRKA